MLAEVLSQAPGIGPRSREVRKRKFFQSLREGSQAGHALGHALAGVLDLEQHDGGEERLLVLEVVVDRRLAHPRALGDLAHGNVQVPAIKEHGPGVLEDSFATRATGAGTWAGGWIRCLGC